MKNSLIAIALMMLCGCMSADCFVSPTANPVKGERYKLYFRDLQVVQVCEDSVHVMMFDEFVNSYDGLRVCIIPIENDYVTGSYLRPGVYEYVGPYTYETIKDLPGNKQTNTIRLFREVKE